MFSAELVVPALGGSLRKLHPAQLVRNPVLFTTAVVALLLTVLLFVGQTGLSLGFQIQLIVWLWLTVLFGTFAEAWPKGAAAPRPLAARHAVRPGRPPARWQQGLCRHPARAQW
jgi:K+-transporting ATPase ATPase B chain